MQHKLLGEGNTEVAKSEASLGELLIAGNELAEAEPLYRDALIIRRKAFGASSTLAANSLADLGRLLEQEGKLEEAKNLYLGQAGTFVDFALKSQYCLSACCTSTD